MILAQRLLKEQKYQIPLQPTKGALFSLLSPGYLLQSYLTPRHILRYDHQPGSP